MIAFGPGADCPRRPSINYGWLFGIADQLPAAQAASSASLKANEVAIVNCQMPFRGRALFDVVQPHLTGGQGRDGYGLHYSRMMSTKRPAKRPGGRTAAVSSAIRTAVEELVAEKGRDRVSIPMVAERAGVNPTTVYRRWPDAATMINDIATYRLDPARPMPDTGDLQSDISGWATEILTHYRKPINAALLRGGAAAAGDSESDCLRGRVDEAAQLVANAGPNAPVTAEDVVDRVLAPIMYRVIFLPWTLTDDYGQSLTKKLFDDAR